MPFTHLAKSWSKSILTFTKSEPGGYCHNFITFYILIPKPYNGVLYRGVFTHVYLLTWEMYLPKFLILITSGEHQRKYVLLFVNPNFPRTPFLPHNPSRPYPPPPLKSPSKSPSIWLPFHPITNPPTTNSAHPSTPPPQTSTPSPH